MGRISPDGEQRQASSIKRVLMTGLILILAPRPAAAQASQTLAQIPVYPGATRDPTVEQKDEVERLYRVGEYERAFTVAAPIEEVIRFYRQRLAAQEIRTEADQERADRVRENLRPGSVSPVWLEVRVHDFDNAEAWGHVVRVATPERLRQVFAQKRPPYRPGAWAAGATFSWVRQTEDGEQELLVSLEDANAIEIVQGGYRPQTAIRFARGETAAEAAEFERQSREAAREGQPPADRQPRSTGAPSERELGVALYPGATFNRQTSEEMSSDTEQYFVFLTPDPPAKVVAFYETKTGKKATGSEGGSLIAVRGEGPFPELGVTIQVNTMFPSPARP